MNSIFSELLGLLQKREETPATSDQRHKKSQVRFTGKREWKRSVGHVIFILTQFLGLDALCREDTAPSTFLDHPILTN